MIHFAKSTHEVPQFEHLLLLKENVLLLLLVESQGTASSGELHSQPHIKMRGSPWYPSDGEDTFLLD